MVLNAANHLPVHNSKLNPVKTRLHVRRPPGGEGTFPIIFLCDNTKTKPRPLASEFCHVYDSMGTVSPEHDGVEFEHDACWNTEEIDGSGLYYETT